MMLLKWGGALRSHHSPWNKTPDNIQIAPSRHLAMVAKWEASSNAIAESLLNGRTPVCDFPSLFLACHGHFSLCENGLSRARSPSLFQEPFASGWEKCASLWSAESSLGEKIQLFFFFFKHRKSLTSCSGNWDLSPGAPSLSVNGWLVCCWRCYWLVTLSCPPAMSLPTQVSPFLRLTHNQWLISRKYKAPVTLLQLRKPWRSVRVWNSLVSSGAVPVMLLGEAPIHEPCKVVRMIYLFHVLPPETEAHLQ